VQAINISFTLSSLVMLGGMNRLGLLNSRTLLVAVGNLAPVLLTVYFAGRIQNLLSGSLHRKIVMTFLLIMGLVLLARVLI